LYGNKGKFEEDDLRSIFAEYDMDVPSAKRFLSKPRVTVKTNLSSSFFFVLLI